jgi:hypothetical protein
VLWTGRFEKFLEMLFGRLSLALEVMFDSRHTVLIGVTGSLVATAVVSYHGEAMGLPHLSLLATLSTFPSALDGGLGGCDSTTISDRFRVA